ncbi:MAG: hypothetical protein R3A52_16430 [Polyangiales bacterium]
MIVFVPVTKYSVQYQVATGRPYSALERLVLDAVGEGHRTLDTLCNVFQVHRRVVVEAIVTLMRAGWLALSSNEGFVLSDLGRRVLNERKDTLPPSIHIEERRAHVILERVQGQVAKNSDVAYVPRSRLREHWELGAHMPKGDRENGVQPGMIESLLYRDQKNGEWIRWIGPTHVVRDNVDFVVVHVDPEREVITGIPPQWEALLKEDLLDRARRFMRRNSTQSSGDSELRQFVRLPTRQVEVNANDPDRHVIRLTQGDLIFGHVEHRTALAAWLEKARTFVVITSAFLSEKTIIAIQPALAAAVKRGILVEIVWGSAEGIGHGAAMKILKKLEYDSLHAGGTGRLIINRRPTNSRAEVILGDVEGRVSAVLGGGSLLHDDDGPSISIKLRHPSILTTLCRVLADLSSRDPNLASGTGVLLLRNSAATLMTRFTDEQFTGDTEVCLVIDRQHIRLLGELSERPPAKLWIGAREWTAIGHEATLLIERALEKGCGDLRVYASVSADAVEDRARIEKHGGVVDSMPAPSVLASDDLAIVGSWPWLASASSTSGPYGTNLGVLLRGPGVAEVTQLFIKLGE